MFLLGDEVILIIFSTHGYLPKMSTSDLKLLPEEDQKEIESNGKMSWLDFRMTSYYKKKYCEMVRKKYQRK